MIKEQEAQQTQTLVEDRKKRDAESWERYLHEQSRSYPEDLLDIDHGAYRNDCSTCGKPFQGFKRRFICRVCEIANLKEIVDSQAQKIKQLEKDFNLAATIAQKHKDDLDAITKEYEDYKHKSGEVVVDLIDKNNQQAQKIKEQAKEIERLNKAKGEQDEI